MGYSISLNSRPMADYIEGVYFDIHFHNEDSRKREALIPMLAERASVSKRTIWRIFSNSRISIDTIDKVCNALEVHPAEIYGEEW